MNRPRRMTIVLTGASGVVGQALLPELSHHEVICLVNRSSLNGGYEVVRTDVTRPQLGLDGDTYRDLARRADCVVHSAAVTDWAEPEARIRTANIEGTRHVLDFARDAEAPLFHMSTSFIRAIAPDAPLALPPSHIIVNYVTSKRDAEQLVMSSGLPCTIFRPTNLIGDSRTGQIARNQIVQLVGEFVCRGKVPLLPARAGTLVDVIPQDVFAKAVVAVIEAQELGKEYWLTYGPDAMDMSMTIDLCIEFMERIGRPIQRPLIVDPGDLDAYSAQLASLPPFSRAFFARLVEFSDGMTACGVFPTSLAELTERHSLASPAPADAYVRGLEYWATSKSLLPPRDPAALA